jgi:L-lactate dehydrogenase (cytochrome)
MSLTITNIEDLQRLARRRVPRMFYDYADSGSWTESTYRANEADFKKILLRQRVAVDMSDRSTATTMAGQAAAMPVAIAPTGMTGMQHADGEILAARAAEAMGVPFTLSTMSICSIEDVAAHTRSPFWFQLYVMRDRDFVERLIDRAKAAKCSALMLTLDLQILGQRHKDLKNGLSAPPKPTLANLINLATKPRWCLGMLGTKRRGFGNIVGHAKGVGDLSSLSAWTAEQFDPRLNGSRSAGAARSSSRASSTWRTLAWPPTAAPTRWWSATTAGGSSTGHRRPSPRCRPSSRRWARAWRCGWTAASAPGRTC